ncbi:ABC transporter permease [Gracilimonas mengyeensis]|uniref:ABC-type transport system, involved in lipoprotein release, permease component n=1 Tax=Gracilimonas mengyeensis TaxID=1302730 RepID=A0A521BFK8_9BACT|nr:FtsX-like permease family protein [Gracilimonas mengyeensis]SMO45853.1 ABC-type transport system, involved in lipoprotein release, permease component [Gracilimonas mengyeensis]
MKFWAILKLSWKNVWRNPLRSTVVIMAVLLGTWAGIFSTALMSGLSMQYIKNQLDTSIAHLQIHHPKYQEENLPRYYIPNPDSLVDALQQYDFVQSVSPRTVVQGLASSTANSYGVTVKGIVTEMDTLVSDVHEYLKEGEGLAETSRNTVLIGDNLAKRLKLELRSRMVINFQDVEGNLTAGAFRVAGIFDTPNSVFDETHVFAKQEDLGRLLGRSHTIHEVALRVDDFKQADAYRDSLAQTSSLQIESWGDVSPSLRYTDSSLDFVLYIIMVIIAIALTFGIINTMLMAVLERTQELGMLMAIGVNRLRTFSMVMLETLFLTMVGVPFGMLLSWATIQWVSNVGIDLSAFAQGLEEYGMSTVVYPQLPEGYFLNIGLLMLVATLLAAVYPSIKALKLNPVQAIRKV